MKLLILALDPVPPVMVPDAAIIVVAPALNSRLRRWLSDEDAARGRADERAAAFVARLARSGVHADGRIGDADPLLAIADALRTFPADKILIAGETDETARFADRIVSRARARFAIPVVRAEERLSTAA